MQILEMVSNMKMKVSRWSSHEPENGDSIGARSSVPGPRVIYIHHISLDLLNGCGLDSGFLVGVAQGSRGRALCHREGFVRRRYRLRFYHLLRRRVWHMRLKLVSLGRFGLRSALRHDQPVYGICEALD